MEEAITLCSASTTLSHWRQLLFPTNDNVADRDAIEHSALFRAYGKPLLSAMCLHVAAAKLCKLIDLLFDYFAPLEREKLHEGVKTLRDQAATIPGGVSAFVQLMISFTNRTMSLFRSGREHEELGNRKPDVSSLPIRAEQKRSNGELLPDYSRSKDKTCRFRQTFRD